MGFVVVIGQIITFESSSHFIVLYRVTSVCCIVSLQCAVSCHFSVLYRVASVCCIVTL